MTFRLPSPARPVSVFALVASLLLGQLGCATEATGMTSSPPSPAFQTKVTGAASLERGDSEGVVVRLDQPGGHASVEFDYPAGHLDLSTFRDLSVKVHNRSSAELDVLVTGLSKLVDTYKNSAQTRFLVRPGEQTDLCVFMARPALPKDHPFVQRLGNLFAFPWGHQRHWQHVDPAAIIRVTAQLDWRGARPGESLTVSPPFGHGVFSVDPSKLDELALPVVDDFGQDRSQTWPGKVGRLEDLREDAVKDLALVASVTSPRGERSPYGGDLRSPRQTATGFFRVEKINGKWWFIDPEGHLFWSLGVNGAAGSSSTRVTGREALFPSSVRHLKELNHYEENVKLKHGEAAWRKARTDVTLARMMSWGLNTVGAWSADELSAARRVPYSLIIHLGYQRIGTNKKIADPYSAEFKKDLDNNLAKLAARHADSPWLLGVFIDNELEWGSGIKLSEQVLHSAPRTPARQALVAFLQKRYPDLAALNQAWSSSAVSFETLQLPEGKPATSACQQDLRDFQTVFAEDYFAACAAAMDKHFPNHLYLGCRFHVLNPAITAVASRHCDVLSVNAYRYSVANLSLVTTEDKPYLISEYHFGVRDYGVWGVGLTWAADARNQSDLVRAYLSDALRHPNVVGAHWFQWSGQAVTGRYDGENFGVGLVTIVDRPVQSLVDAFTTVSDSLYGFRRDPAPAHIGAPVAR